MAGPAAGLQLSGGLLELARRRAGEEPELWKHRASRVRFLSVSSDAPERSPAAVCRRRATHPPSLLPSILSPPSSPASSHPPPPVPLPHAGHGLGAVPPPLLPPFSPERRCRRYLISSLPSQPRPSDGERGGGGAGTGARGGGGGPGARVAAMTRPSWSMPPQRHCRSRRRIGPWHGASWGLWACGRSAVSCTAPRERHVRAPTGRPAVRLCACVRGRASA